MIATRAREAPQRPGVYFLLGPGRELFYVGKAGNLRRRLLDHARASDGARLQRLIPRVRDVRWIECDTEREALCREADVVAALAPSFNAAIAEEAFVFVRVERASGTHERGALRLELTENGHHDGGRIYGGFPHLGKGKASWAAVRCNAGYSALLRLLWVAFADPEPRFRSPARLRGSSPPMAHTAPFDDSRSPLLHDFLSGRSARLLRLLRESATATDVPAYLRAPLAADLERAEEFFVLGPRAMRRLRLRHRLRPGPVDLDTFIDAVTGEVREAIGSFTLPPRSSEAGVVGLRTGRSIHLRNLRSKSVPS